MLYHGERGGKFVGAEPDENFLNRCIRGEGDGGEIEILIGAKRELKRDVEGCFGPNGEVTKGDAIGRVLENTTDAGPWTRV